MSSYIIIAVLSPVAVVGNSLILAAIWKKTFQRMRFHILLSGLAITDLCTGLFSQPFIAAAAFLNWEKPEAGIEQPLLVIVIQTIGDSSTTYFTGATLFIITLMSIERWLIMSRRSLATSTKQGRCLTVTIVLLIPIPFAVFRSFDSVNQNFGTELNIITLCVMLICFLTTTVAYFNVFQIIRRHQLQVRANTLSQNFVPSAINFSKNKKSVVTILYILALFSICFLPYIAALGVCVNVDDDNSQIQVASSVTLALLFLSSSLNPCLYLWRMNDVRKGVIKLLCWNS